MARGGIGKPYLPLVHRLQIPVNLSCSFNGEPKHTNEQYQTFSWSLVILSFHAITSHARDNWTDKINVEDGVYVDQMKDHSNGQKAKSIDSRHVVQTVQEY